MVMTTARRIFVDTNVLTRATIDAAPLHIEARSHPQAALAGSSGHRQEMDHARCQLGEHLEPVSDPV